MEYYFIYAIVPEMGQTIDLTHTKKANRNWLAF
jgi:hypothetical protein